MEEISLEHPSSLVHCYCWPSVSSAASCFLKYLKSFQHLDRNPLFGDVKISLFLEISDLTWDIPATTMSCLTWDKVINRGYKKLFFAEPLFSVGLVSFGDACSVYQVMNVLGGQLEMPPAESRTVQYCSSDNLWGSRTLKLNHTDSCSTSTVWLSVCDECYLYSSNRASPTYVDCTQWYIRSVTLRHFLGFCPLVNWAFDHSHWMIMIIMIIIMYSMYLEPITPEWPCAGLEIGKILPLPAQACSLSSTGRYGSEYGQAKYSAEYSGGHRNTASTVWISWSHAHISHF